MRVGRGIGSGKGKTSGRGFNGQKSRSGVAIKGFEGGQMPLSRRLPKRGFNNIFAKDFNEVALGRVQMAIDAGKLDAAQTVDAASLKDAGVIRRIRDGVRLLGGGELKAAVTFEVAGRLEAGCGGGRKIRGKCEVCRGEGDNGRLGPERSGPMASAAEQLAANINFSAFAKAEAA